MTAAQVLQLVLQIIALSQTVEPFIVQAVKDFQALLANGGAPSQAEIDALLARVQSQSAMIQAMD